MRALAILSICAGIVGSWGGARGAPISDSGRALASSTRLESMNPTRAFPMTPTRSYHTLTSANGRVAVVCGDDSWAIHSIHEHIYQRVSAGEKTRVAEWVHELPATPAMSSATGMPVAAGYVPGTGIIRHTGWLQPGVERTQYIFAPYGAPGDSARGEVLVLTLLHNTGASAATLHAADRGRTLPGPDADTHGEWDLPAHLAASESAWRGLRLRLAPGEGTALTTRERLAPDTARAAYDAELANWSAWHAVEKLPAGMSETRAALYRQSTAMLRMAQCTEPGSAHGQIVASLPPGQWNITWVRDGCYAIAGLVASGHFAEARAALDFFRGAHAGRYRAFNYGGRNYGIEADYGLSVCRYFGNGDEESDSNSAGPNIELDGFGLYPWAAALYVQASGDSAWVRDAYPWIAERVLRLIPLTLDHSRDIVTEESGIWERHIGPPNGPEFAKNFAWTTAVNQRGLRSGGALARASGHGSDTVSLASFAAAMSRGFRAAFVAPDGVVRGNLQTPAERNLDASAAEAFCAGVLDPRGPEFVAFRAACDARLRTAAGPGYRRNLDGTWYDEQEWVFCDLRMARALQLAGDAAAADALIDWVTAHAVANHQLIPELLTARDARFAGAIPMAGYGAAAYILALHPDFDRPPAPPVSHDRDD